MVFTSACSVIARSVLSLPVSAAFSALLLTAAPALAEPQRLVALGDSLTQGYGLSEGDGFVPQLEAWLHAKGYDVQLVNAGVSGDTSQGGLSRLE